MCFLLYLLLWTTIESLNPMRSEGTVPPDTLWHIKMMSPPLSSEMTIRKMLFALFIVGCGEYALCVNEESSCNSESS